MLILQIIRLFLWVSLLFCPLLLWWDSANVPDLYRYGAPAGQLYYVFAKLAGLYAVLALWLQAMGLLLRDSACQAMLPAWSMSRHRWIGRISVLAVVLHATLFITAVSLRQGGIAWGWFLPNVNGFYHTAASLGWLATVLMAAALMALAYRKRFPFTWRIVHRIMLAVVVLGFVHGYLIGTETRYGWYLYFYLGLAVCLLAGVAVFLFSRKKRTVKKGG